MADELKHIVEVTYRRVIVPVQYEAIEARVVFSVASENVATEAKSLMEAAKQEVHTALGINAGLPGVTEVAGAVKRGPGRPPKVAEAPKEPEAVKPNISSGEERKDPPADEWDDSGKVETVREITDKELNAACSETVAVVGDSAKVRSVISTNFGVKKVADLKQSDRPAFVKALADLRDAHKQKG